MSGRLGCPRHPVRSGVETPETERIEVPAPAPLEVPVPAPPPDVPVQPAGVPA
jgi:hypothetical protein